jgi:hypothetical protein
VSRLYVIVEGDTEERFVNGLLAQHLATFGIDVRASKVVTRGRRGNAAARGGGRRYGHWRDDLNSWIKQQHNHPNVWFTTMLDYYGLAKFTDGFPGYDLINQQQPPLQRVEQLETAWAEDIGFDHFIPYLQLHEFEALLLVNCAVLKEIFNEGHASVDQLAEEIGNLRCDPEEINDGEITAPSKRIIKFIPQYRFRKASAGPLAAGKIGLQNLRQACPHFHNWITKLEKLPS